jgi:hypothetical protein
MSIISCPQCGKKMDLDKEELFYCDITDQSLCEHCAIQNAEEAEDDFEEDEDEDE